MKTSMNIATTVALAGVLSLNLTACKKTEIEANQSSLKVDSGYSAERNDTLSVINEDGRQKLVGTFEKWNIGTPSLVDYLDRLSGKGKTILLDIKMIDMESEYQTGSNFSASSFYVYYDCDTDAKGEVVKDPTQCSTYEFDISNAANSKSQITYIRGVLSISGELRYKGCGPMQMGQTICKIESR